MRTLLALVILVAACTPSSLPLRDFAYYYQPQTAYAITPSTVTPKGVRVDAGGPINLARIDRLFDEVEACLTKAFPGGVLPPETKALTSSVCVGSSFPLPIAREKFTVKIARDWVWDTTKTQQLLSVVDPGNGCLAKNQKPPCYWRAMVVDPLKLVTTPNMIELKDVIVRTSTGCLNPWAYAPMAACAMPSTKGTDDGTEP